MNYVDAFMAWCDRQHDRMSLRPARLKAGACVDHRLKGEYI
jgi:hypothetical protein